MVPVRVHLSGFLTYREPVSLDFEKSDLWLLWGRNGVGKSSVFDAISFALFGQGRFGGRIVTDYVNHRCTDMAVEFDFDLGQDRWRVKRTAKQSGGGGSSYQVFSINRNTGAAQTIPGTHTRDGFQQWMDDNFPLNFDSFRAAALLQQGHADVLLDANAEMRRSFMDKIVNLRAYTNFHQEVSAAANTLRNERDRLNLRMDEVLTETRGKISGLVAALVLEAAQQYPTDGQKVKASAVKLARALDGIHQETEKELEDIVAAGKGVTALAAHLTTQEKAIFARAELLRKRMEYADILDRADEIEKRAARLVLLQATVADVEAFVRARENWRDGRAKAEEARQRIEEVQGDGERLAGERDAAEGLLDAARAESTRAQARLTEAKTLLKSLREREKQLSGNEGKAACQVCGQPLTPEQMAQERERLQREIVDAQNAVQEATRAD